MSALLVSLKDGMSVTETSPSWVNPLRRGEDDALSRESNDTLNGLNAGYADAPFARTRMAGMRESFGSNMVMVMVMVNNDNEKLLLMRDVGCVRNV